MEKREFSAEDEQEQERREVCFTTALTTEGMLGSGPALAITNAGMTCWHMYEAVCPEKYRETRDIPCNQSE